MKEGSRVPVTFLPREEVLEPAAAVAFAPVARVLAERLLEYSDEQLGEWTGVAGAGVLVVLGTAHSLPWVNGVSYLGRDPRAPRLFVPTTTQASPAAIEVFERAILRRHERLAPPLAVVVSPPRILSLSEALPIRRDRIRAWLEVNP